MRALIALLSGRRSSAVALAACSADPQPSPYATQGAKIGESLAVLGWNVSAANLRFDGDYVLVDVDASPSQAGGQHAKVDSLRFGLYGALAHPIESTALGSCSGVTNLNLQPAVSPEPRKALGHSLFGAAARPDAGPWGVRCTHRRTGSPAPSPRMARRSPSA